MATACAPKLGLFLSVQHLTDYGRANISNMGRKFSAGLIVPFVAVALAVPVKADTNAQERRFLAELKAAGWTINDPSRAITQGRMVCGEGLEHHVPWQEMRTTLMGWGYSRLDASTLISKAVSVFCPKYDEVISEIEDDLGAGSANQDDLFVQQLKQQWGLSIDKGAALDMAAAGCQAPIAGLMLDAAQRVMQKRYPRYDLNTVARVMAAGVLTFCPERLP